MTSLCPECGVVYEGTLCPFCGTSQLVKEYEFHERNARANAPYSWSYDGRINPIFDYSTLTVNLYPKWMQEQEKDKGEW